VGGRDYDRRQFLAAGGGGLLLCTLGGQQIYSDREADVSALASDLEVPPKVAAAQRSGATPVSGESEAVLAAARADGSRREYWIKAEQVKWNALPRQRDGMTNKKVKTKGKFQAYAYRGYTQGFAQPIAKASIPGPVIEAYVGDTVVVNFRNETPGPVTIHPHGIQYSADMDGAYKGKFTEPGGFVQPGEEFQYTWEAVPGTEGTWLYHDHGPLDPVPLYKGLFGPMIVRPAGSTPPDKEFWCFFHSFQPVATGLDVPIECINGRSYAGNTPTFKSNVGDRVAFHVVALDDDFHTFHIHGHRWQDADGTIIDTKTVGPGDSFTAEFTENNPGRWFYHCHVFSHLHQGMNGWYLVE